MNRKAYITSLMLAAALSAAAQSYTKDVDVTVELQPELRAASRLDVSPMALRRPAPSTTLQYSRRAMALPVTPLVSTLQPADSSLIYSPSDLDGYLVAGYFPGLDLGASAGYRLVRTASTSLNAMAQFNRNSYKGFPTLEPVDDESKRRLTTTDFDLGLDFCTVSRYGTLSAATSLYLSHFNYTPGAFDPSSQNVSRYRLSAGWHSTHEDDATGYSVDADIDWFHYGKACFPSGLDYSGLDRPDPLHELNGGVKASGQYMFTDAFGLAVTAGWRGAALNEHYLYMPGTGEFHPAGRFTRGVVNVGASIRFKTSKFSGHVGPRFDFGTGDGGSTHTGAQGTISWNVSPYFLMFSTAESGTQLNTLGSLYERSRYAAPLAAAPASFLAADIKYGISVGPYKGLSLTLQGGFSSASDWVLPTVADGVSTFSSTNLDAGWYSVSLQYDRPGRFSFKATLEGALNNAIDHAYYKWTDRASHVLDVTLQWHPVDELTIEGGYLLRTGRKVVTIDSMTDEAGSPMFTTCAFQSLGRISAGRVGIAYTFDDYWGLFARVEGIGQGRYMLPANVAGQRLHGVAGITLRF